MKWRQMCDCKKQDRKLLMKSEAVVWGGHWGRQVSSLCCGRNLWLLAPGKNILWKSSSENCSRVLKSWISPVESLPFSSQQNGTWGGRHSTWEPTKTFFKTFCEEDTWGKLHWGVSTLKLGIQSRGPLSRSSHSKQVHVPFISFPWVPQTPWWTSPQLIEVDWLAWQSGWLAGICSGCLWSSRKKHRTSLEGEESSWRKYNRWDKKHE